MAAWNSTSSLTDLRSRVLPFGLAWQEETGRQLRSARDGIDFLTAMKGREGFWAALLPLDPTAALPIDAATLRDALPASELPRDVEPETYLRSIGLSETDIRAMIVGLDAPILVEDAIRAAFAEETPQRVARALERVLDGDGEVVATERYVARMAEATGVGRTLGVLMGTVVLLVGTTLAACASQCGRPTTSPNSASPRQGTTAPEPPPAGASQNTPPEPPRPPPPAPPDPSPNPLPPPVPAYKGVSPKRRGAQLQ